MTKQDKTIFHVQKRETVGKKVKSLRKEGKIPGNIHGLNKDSEAVLMHATEVNKILRSGGESGLFYVQVEGSKKETPVLLDEVEHHPVTSDLLHVVFRRVNLKEKVEADIPVETIGEFDVPQATTIQVYDSLTVSALPTDLPENFTVDLSTLTEVGQAITVADLDYDKTKVEIIDLEEGEETQLVIVQEVQEEPEETEESDDEESSEESEGGSDEKADAQEDASAEDSKE